MMPIKIPTIDELKESYKYEIDPSNSLDTINLIYAMHYGHFVSTLEKYRFNESIQEI